MCMARACRGEQNRSDAKNIGEWLPRQRSAQEEAEKSTVERGENGTDRKH
jgi:hypothetical protein